LIAHGKPVASFIGLRPGNGEQIPPDNSPETLSEKRGLAKGEDSFDLDKEGGLGLYVSLQNGQQADVAQLVEQLIRNQQVWGSNPHIGSRIK
jgi:hypothetical protein